MRTVRSLKQFGPGPERALRDPDLSNFYLESKWQAMNCWKSPNSSTKPCFWSSKPETKSVLASCPVHPYKEQERNQVGSQDVESYLNNPAESWRVENGVNLLNKRLHCPGVEVSKSTQAGRSSRDFVISSPDMYPHSRARLMCALVPPHLTPLCWGQTQELCMVSRSSKVPTLVEGRPTVQCNRDLLLSLPESSLNHLCRY